MTLTKKKRTRSCPSNQNTHIVKELPTFPLSAECPEGTQSSCHVESMKIGANIYSMISIKLARCPNQNGEEKPSKQCWRIELSASTGKFMRSCPHKQKSTASWDNSAFILYPQPKILSLIL